MEHKAFVAALGFSGLSEKHIKGKKAARVRAFVYKTVNNASVKAILGKPTAVNSINGQLVYVVAKDKVIRVDTLKKVVLLGNGADTVKRVLNTVTWTLN